MIKKKTWIWNWAALPGSQISENVHSCELKNHVLSMSYIQSFKIWFNICVYSTTTNHRLEFGHYKEELSIDCWDYFLVIWNHVDKAGESDVVSHFYFSGFIGSSLLII